MLCKFKIGPILLYFLLEEQHWSWWWLARFPARSKTRNWLATPHPLDLLFCHVQGVRGSRARATCLEQFPLLYTYTGHSTVPVPVPSSLVASSGGDF